MRNFPFISIIIPVRNAERTLDKTFEYLLNIDYPRDKMEIVISDGGSTDSTILVIEEWQKRYPFIKLVKITNCPSPAYARNKALEIIKGEFIFFTDDDDLVLPNRISSPLSHICKNPILDVVYCNYNVVDDMGNIRPVQCEPFNHQAYLNLKFNIGSGILFGRRNVFMDVPFYSRYDLAIDYDWVFRLLRKNYQIDLCPEIVMNYNRSGDAIHHLSGNRESKTKHNEIYEREILLENLKRY